MAPAPRPAHAPFTALGPPMTRSAPQAPLRLGPALHARPWGGRRLPGRWAGAGLEPATEVGPIGEAWLAGPDARVTAGPWAGARVEELARTFGAAFVGTVPHARHGARMPLLVKLLDAAEPLSVQVHPDDGYAARHEAASGHLGKTEAWWVLEAEPGAHVWWGFAASVTRTDLEAARARTGLVPLLRRLAVAAGDVVVNPAGTVHALGPGLLVYEVQQASDLTYRLDDHGRVGADGRPRALHWQAGLAVAHLEPGEAPAPVPRAVAPGRTVLAHPEPFALERVDAGERPTWTVGAGSLEVLTHVTGPAATLHGRWGATALDVGATLLLPAGLGPVTLEGGATAARAWCPDA